MKHARPRWWRIARRSLLVSAVLVPACAPKTPPVAPTTPQFQEFVFPSIPNDLQRAFGVAAKEHDVAWALLQRGDLRGADRRLSAVLKQAPAFYPSEAAQGYVDLARREYKRATERFDRALSRNGEYVPALVGRGQALLAVGRDEDALGSFEAALTADRSLTDVRQRVDVLRLKTTQANLVAAQRAGSEGRFVEARDLYSKAIAASPDSGFLYRERAIVERRLDAPDAALEDARKAVELDTNDGAAQLMVAELLEARADMEGALAAYRRAAALDAAPGLEDKIAALEDQLALSKLPESYHKIGTAPRVARGDLAALLGIRLEPVLKTARQRDGVLITDVRGNWAQTYITAVTRAGVMDAFANHTFQPAGPIRRSDLAQASSRVLTLIAARDKKLGEPWMGARRKFPDLGPGHLAYVAASMSVAAGVLPTADGEPFQPGRAVTGAEAIQAIERLTTLAAQAGLGGRSVSRP